mmetsp:Transcript_7479/g.22070  ORF Transcript_7479/g.22070 Transcript_7479/m.22070 type:complete len:229 (+) Transcript_7479:153-839(+)
MPAMPRWHHHQTAGSLPARARRKLPLPTPGFKQLLLIATSSSPSSSSIDGWRPPGPLHWQLPHSRSTADHYRIPQPPPPPQEATMMLGVPTNLSWPAYVKSVRHCGRLRLPGVRKRSSFSPARSRSMETLVERTAPCQSTTESRCRHVSSQHCLVGPTMLSASVNVGCSPLASSECCSCGTSMSFPQLSRTMITRRCFNFKKRSAPGRLSLCRRPSRGLRWDLLAEPR